MRLHRQDEGAPVAFTGPPVKRPVEEAEPRQGGMEIMAMSLRRCLDVAKAITLPPPVNRFR